MISLKNLSILIIRSNDNQAKYAYEETIEKKYNDKIKVIDFKHYVDLISYDLDNYVEDNIII